MENPFRPLTRIDGYLPIGDHGLIGDGSTAALVARDGDVTWLCVPKFDSPPLFCRLLDTGKGGAFSTRPENLIEARQEYAPDTGVLITELRSASGLVRITDALTFRPGSHIDEDRSAARQELLRSVQVLDGSVRLEFELAPRGGATLERSGDVLRIHCASRPDLALHFWSDRPLQGLKGRHDLRAGDALHFILSWAGGPHRHPSLPPELLLKNTMESWRRWLAAVRYEGPQEKLVRRSAITLKLLDNFENGAIIAAPTSSLPEVIGGGRNWDYRYTWIRDAAFSVYALRRIGLDREARSFLKGILSLVKEGRPGILYNLEGGKPPPEWEDGGLEGYRRSSPVRWGNAAADQRQHDVYGEIIDCAYQWVARGGELEGRLWSTLSRFVDAAAREWTVPDHGIWEVRTTGSVFTYSAAMCQVALDRGARIAKRLGLPGNVAAWEAEAGNIRAAIIERAWDDKLRSFTGNLGGGSLDASLLALPLRRVLPADHPRMIATTEAVVRRLDAGKGLLYRYHPDESPDGLEGQEGAFLLCSFWLVDNLAHQGRMEEAMDLYDSLCGRVGPLGLLPEQIDPASGAFLGNFPQAFSHVGVISSGINLAGLSRKGGGVLR